MEIRTLADVTAVQSQRYGDRPALTYVSDGRTWSFRQLDEDANRVAQALLADGVGAHDLVAYLDKNAPEYFLYLYGGAKLNAVSVAVNWRLAPPEMEYVLNNSEAKVLVIGEEFLPALTQMSLEHVERVVVLGDPGDSGHLTWDQWLAPQAANAPQVEVTAEDTCYQLYTSGTTGLPKGVELTHANFMHCLEHGLSVLNMNESSVNLVCMPLFHISGGAWGVLGAYWGANTILLREVDLPTILRAVPEHGVTHTFFVPAVMQFLLNEPNIKEIDFSTLESITYGASPITEAVLVEAMDTFQCGFVQAYGLTETTGAVSVLPPQDHDPGGARAHLLRSCGQSVRNHRIKIVDPETLEDAPDGTVGEIWIAGPQTMKGYWKNPQATDEAYVDEWFRSGDAGYMQEGYLYIHDRVKDMIISGGENIYPAEIENVLMRHEAVADAAVIGVPDDRWGEAVKAIITRTDAQLSEQAVLEYCRSQLAGYKCPKSVDWMDEIPRNPSGKILKTELRKPYWAGQNRQVS